MDNNKRTRNHRRSQYGAGKARRRFNRLESLNDLAIVLFLFVEPISNMLASFGEIGRDRFDSFMHWVRRFREQPGGEVPRRALSRDLKSVQFLKQGFSGYIYETTWLTWYGMGRPGRFARKDFPGVDSKVFEGEAARLVNLDHPNVVKTYCWTVDRLGCSLVMEFVNDDLESVVRKRKAVRRSLQSKGAAEDPGKTVDIVTANTPFELVEAMYIMWHIAAAMEYLHSMEVAHGDLRPNNVLVDLDPGRMIVKVGDFGLNESKKRTTLISKRAKFLQILEWKAPEMCKELVSSLNVTSDQYPWTSCTEHSDDFQKLRMADMYSFAILCTYIMGGIVSYPRSSLTELQQKLLSGVLKPKIPSTCPRPLKKLIESCLSRIAPEKRIGFHEFRKQLEDIIRQETITERLNHPEVGGIMQRWVENIQRMDINNTLYYTCTATLYFAEMHISASATILVDTFPPVEKAKLPLSESAEQPPSPSTKPPPRSSLVPLARLTADQPTVSEGPNSPSARLNSEPTLGPESPHSTLVGLSIEVPAKRLEIEPTFETPSVTPRVSIEIERSTSLWSELSDPVETDEEIREQNLRTFASLKETYGEFFHYNMDNFQMGKKIALGGQSEIFRARRTRVFPFNFIWLHQEGEFVLKVFTPLKLLQNQMPMDFLVKEAHAYKEGKSANPRLCHIFGGLLMDDGRFAFMMERYWGDLRKLIDIRMKDNGKQAPPFTTMVAKRIMLEITEGMIRLHEHNVAHRDVKATNIFIKPLAQTHKFHPKNDDAFSCLVGDFECSKYVVGTTNWRAPEILLAIQNSDLNREHLFTEKSDVYSFSMTCYEIVTGKIPFEDLPIPTIYDTVPNGHRPMLPDDVHPAMADLLHWCWRHEPSERPTFVEILEKLNGMIVGRVGKVSRLQNFVKWF